MTPGRIFFVGLLLIAGVLFVLNPGEDQFRAFLSREAAERAGEGRSGWERFVAERVGEGAALLGGDLFERDNYYVASVYRADLNGRMPGGEWTFLGVAGAFIPLDQPLDEE